MFITASSAILKTYCIYSENPEKQSNLDIDGALVELPKLSEDRS